MDIVFNCPNCDQELAVDHSGAGSQIECPACGEKITIPAAGKVTTGPLPDAPHPPPSPTASSINTSAAAKVEMHLKVPVRDTPAESLIGKPKPPLEIVQKGAGKKLRIHTIRRASCIESGHDKFDEKVSDFLQQVGEGNIVSLHTISYEMFDVGVQKIMTDYGILVVYRG
jgi:DNA-directed RNA polymerase subunit RPC12/RpoP